jgi:hypothetical protein
LDAVGHGSKVCGNWVDDEALFDELLSPAILHHRSDWKGRSQ